MILNDPFGAFGRHTHVALAGSSHGPLWGQTIAVKDVFDIADYRTGNGHPPVARDPSAGSSHCVGS
jgi:Asp-tRNA(Asn)/Glu-tRNA(Gln) amidotransferase A subunit family amidase